MLALDVCDEGSIAPRSRVAAEQGAVGVLINNAGYGSGAIEEVPMEEVRRQFETNVFGLMRLTQLVLPGMREQGWGKIVNLSSMGGNITLPGGGFYHATKYAVEAISDALRFEVQGFGIDVIVIEPGPIKTEFGDTAAGRQGRGRAVREFNARSCGDEGGLREGRGRKLGGGPETVAKTIERAITARTPKICFRVTPSAQSWSASAGS